MEMNVVVRSVAADTASAFDSVLVGGTIGMVAALPFMGSNALWPLGVGAIAGSSLAASRCLRISLRLGEDGVRIANYFRTRRLSWGDVQAIGWDIFELPHASAPRSPFGCWTERRSSPKRRGVSHAGAANGSSRQWRSSDTRERSLATWRPAISSSRHATTRTSS